MWQGPILLMVLAVVVAEVAAAATVAAVEAPAVVEVAEVAGAAGAAAPVPGPALTLAPLVLVQTCSVPAAPCLVATQDWDSPMAAA